MKLKKLLSLVLIIFAFSGSFASNPVKGLLERVVPGAFDKFDTKVVETPGDSVDWFEVSSKNGKVCVEGNNYVSVATGINWYLKHVAHVHLSWNCMTAVLPEKLPLPSETTRKTTDRKLRYDFNYCTYSYTMPFWDWDRWEKEIDWMALHGVNLPLAAVGQECVWRNMLLRLGYTKEEVNEFIAGPAFLAWWAMNNLEGWGGPNPESWYARQEELQKKILARMREYGIEPALPGYCGMMPHNADVRLGLDVVKSPDWCGFTRPSILNPTDPRFEEMAAIYYDEQRKLYGTAKWYSMDPFHECPRPERFDFPAAGEAVMKAMKEASPESVWVLQAWGGNPREAMIKGLNPGDLLVLDLFGECTPMWGGVESPYARKEGFNGHGWLMCMLENFGGNVGLHGRMDQVLDNYRQISSHPNGMSCRGIGLAMEGTENNPIMYELMCELPWLDTIPDKKDWLRQYVTARYGHYDDGIYKAWSILADGIYNDPKGSIQQGTHESIFCSRPGEDVYGASSWSYMTPYYDTKSTAHAAALMLDKAGEFEGNDNFAYDLTDIVRQAVADEGRSCYEKVMTAYKNGDRNNFEKESKRFLNMILLQDELLGTRQEFRVGTWIQRARNAGKSKAEKDQFEWNARVQITTWGPRVCADDGGLHDYAHKEWNGILRDFYHNRWKTYFETLSEALDGKDQRKIDWYSLEEKWTKELSPYSEIPQGESIPTAIRVYNEVFKGL